MRIYIALLLAILGIVSMAAAEKPRLVLFITVDQFRGDMPIRYADRFGQGGFRYLMEQGYHYRNAHYRHANTFTAVGHATLATGGNTPEHGIAGNEWYDRGTARSTTTPFRPTLRCMSSARAESTGSIGSEPCYFSGSLLGVVGHGSMRYVLGRKQARGPARTERVYMYESYRRFWHWLQTASIVLLLFTGLIIHRPDIFGAFSFRGVVTVHNVLAVILVLNAFLSLFYHIATERIQEFIPRPYGFFDDAIVQAKYYINGIFRHEPHPFEKRPNSRMNPIQKATYFMILNVLLPLQILTGALMWAVQKYPNILGGLPVLAPFHSLVAWLFATFQLAQPHR